MSRRYGRQQKKKARLEIERLNTQIELTDKIVERERKQIASTVESARGIIEVVREICPHSVFLDRSRIGQGDYRASIYSALCNPFVTDEKGSDFHTAIDMRYIDLYDLELSIRDSDFENMIHFDLDLRSPYKDCERSSYRISKEGFKHTPTYKIAMDLVNHLKKAH